MEILTGIGKTDRERMAAIIRGTKGTISEKAMFGLKPVRRGQVKISVSDPTRTILDMMIDPVFGWDTSCKRYAGKLFKVGK